MPQITDYASLQSEAAEWLKRTDLTERIKTFIQLAEARINSEPELDIRAMETRYSEAMVVSQQYYSLPTRFKSMRFINITSVSPLVELEYMPPERFHDFPKHIDGTEDEPEAYTMIGDELKLGPIPDQTYTMEMIYYQSFQALSDSNTTNWLITNQPDIYLYATLLESAPYLVNDERISVWANLYEAGIKRVIEQDKHDRYPTGATTVDMEFNDILLSSSNYGRVNL